MKKRMAVSALIKNGILEPTMARFSLTSDASDAGGSRFQQYLSEAVNPYEIIVMIQNQIPASISHGSAKRRIVDQANQKPIPMVGIVD